MSRLFAYAKLIVMYRYLLVASLLSSFADSLFGPLYAVYVQKIGGDILDVGNTVALYAIATGILIILIGKVSDYVSKELLAVTGFFISSIGTLCYLVIDSPLQLYALQLLFAISTALLSAPLTALFAQYIDDKKSGFMWALQGGGSKILTGIGILCGTFVTYRFGFTVTFILISVLQFSAALFQLRVFLKSRQ